MPVTFQALVTFTTVLTTNVVYEYPKREQFIYLSPGYIQSQDTNATTRKKITRVYVSQIFLIEGTPWSNWTYRLTNEPSLVKETWANEELKYTWAPANTNNFSTNGIVLQGTTISLTNANRLYYENLLHAQ